MPAVSGAKVVASKPASALHVLSAKLFHDNPVSR
jgi:hypothetical protein